MKTILSIIKILFQATLILVVSVALGLAIGISGLNKQTEVKELIVNKYLKPLFNDGKNINSVFEPLVETNCSQQETLKLAKSCTFLVGGTDNHGTGFLVDSKGHLVTNYHVVDTSTDGFVNVWYNGKFVPSRIVGFSVENDLAVLKIEPGFASCEWANSENLELAETVYAVGWPSSPYGDSTITKGVFSRYTYLENNLKMIQTDTPINPGNSGGPLLNECGIVGVNTSKVVWASPDSPSEGLGFAITSNFARNIIGQIIINDDTNPKIPTIKISSSPNENSPSYDGNINQYLNPNSLVAYNYDEVIFWEQRKIQDQLALSSWEKGEDSEYIELEKLHILLGYLKRSVEIANTLWDGYTNSKVTYNQVYSLKEEYLQISRESSIISKELNIEGSINAYKNCIEAWENLEEDYDQDFDEQKENCDSFIE